MRKTFHCIFALLAATLAACSSGAQNQRLAPVPSLPKPALPAWISSISPTARAQSLAQIRVIFAKPITKVESLEGDGPREVLSHLRLDPALPGHFVVLTPRMIGFVAERALPVGTRVTVTLTSGLRDLNGDALDRDLAWTFETLPLEFSDLPTLAVASGEPTPAPVGLRPTLRVKSNAEVDIASLERAATLSAGGKTVALAASLEAQPSPPPGGDAAGQFDASQKDWVYLLRPAADLNKATAYTLTIAPGVEPAGGNLATTKSFTGAIRTFAPLAIVPTPPPSSQWGVRFANGDPVVAFNNPIDQTTLAANVTVSPQPSPLHVIAVPDDQPNGFAIDPYGLDPNSSYTISIAPGLKDVFGQTLASAQSVTIHTGNFAAGAWAPQGTSLIPAGSRIAMNFYATNLPHNAYRFASGRVSPVAMLQFPDPMKELPAAADWRQQSIPGARLNVQSVVPMTLQSLLQAPYGALAYGFATALDSPDSRPMNAGIAQLTNIGVFAQWFPERGFVLAQHLDDGSPAGGAKVTLYRMPPNDGDGTPVTCASGVTDHLGEYDVQGVDLERCYAGAAANEAPSVGVVVSEGADVATLRTYDWSGVYRFDVIAGWTGGRPLSRGIVFSDRQLYQPGERAELTGIAYYADRFGKVVADKGDTYKVSLQDPNGANSSIGQVTTDAFGTFTLPVTFTKSQALGYYTITATGGNGNQLTGSLRVAHFKPPNFKLSLALDKQFATAGGDVKGTATAAYLFGAPLEGGKAHAYVTRELAVLAPKGRDEFTFGRQWFWPEEPPSFQTDVLQREVPLDKSGVANVTVDVANDLPAPLTYRVDVEATDVSNLSVADSQTFLASPADALIGLTSDYVGAAGTPMAVKVIVTDANGNAISGRSVHLDLQKMTYTSVTQAEEGGEAAQQAIKYDTVASADVTSSSDAVTTHLTPADAGAYRVRANFAGTANDASATDMQVFAFGPNAADFGAADTTSVKITLDKKKYRVGDIATALIGSPFPYADVYVAVVRHDTIYRTTLHYHSGSPSISFRVTPEMLPNAALEAVVVRRGDKLAGIKPGTLDSLSRVGMTGFDVDVSDKYLQLGIAPGSASADPGSRQTANFTLTNVNGKPVRGKIVAMVVNDAVLQLSGYRLPDLVQTVFADQPISTRFGDNRENVTLTSPTPPAEKGFGFGGGFLEGAASTRVRTNFQPIAYYGSVMTDAAGKAHIAYSLPDDLTTWRVMAVAVAEDDTHFGTSDATFVTNLPLMANPLLPQFARPGDRFDLGASIMNQTGADGKLDLSATLGGALAFVSGTPQRMQTTEDVTNGMQGYRFPVIVGTPAPSTVAFSANLGAAKDAFSVPFSVFDRATTESVIESGVTTSDGTVPIGLDRGGTLSVMVSNSVVPQFVLPADQAMTDDSFTLTDLSASRLIVASSLRDLSSYRPMLTFDPQRAVDSNLRAVLAAQRADGGFGAFPNGRESDPFVSAYALDALAYARARGVSVDVKGFAQARAFASATLANPERFTWCKDADCTTQLRFEMLWALAQAGDRRTEWLGQIVSGSDRFDTATQIRLARYLLATPGWQTQGAALADHLMQQVNLSGRYAVANVSTRWGWLGSLVDAQAQVVQLMIERHAPPDQLDSAIRALVAQQCKCGWPTLDDAASAMRALDAYAATERLSPMTASVEAGSTPIGSAQFGRVAESKTFTVNAASVRANAIDIRANGGAAHYTVLYTYDVPADAPGTLTAFRVTRELREAGTNDVIARMDLAPVTSPAQLTAGRVFDVGIRIVADHPVDRVIVVDPLPAGLEAVDTAFKTSTQAVVAQSDSWQIDDRELYPDRVMAYAEHLGPGIYEMHYLVRSVTPGTYRWPGANAYLRDAPEQFGRSAAATLQVK